jgi:hypothetical protein
MAANSAKANATAAFAAAAPNTSATERIIPKPPTLTSSLLTPNSSLLTPNFKLLPPPPGFFANYKIHEFILSCFGL